MASSIRGRLARIEQLILAKASKPATEVDWLFDSVDQEVARRVAAGDPAPVDVVNLHRQEVATIAARIRSGEERITGSTLGKRYSATIAICSDGLLDFLCEGCPPHIVAMTDQELDAQIAELEWQT